MGGSTFQTIRGWALVAPALIFIGIFLFVPISSIVALSVTDPTFSFDRYYEIATTKVYRVVLWNTVELGLVVTLATTVLGYPVALVMAHGRNALATILIVVVGIGFWVSFVIRTYSWMVILGTTGLVATFLKGLGWSNPPALLFTKFASFLALTNLMLPMMILIVYARIKRIDLQLVAAAQSLGATPFRAFWHVYFPLSLPGVVNGAVFVFVLVLGFYITPALIGSPNQIILGQLIVLNVEKLLDWGSASALSVVIMVTAVLLVGLFRLFVPDVES